MGKKFNYGSNIKFYVHLHIYYNILPSKYMGDDSKPTKY